MKERGNQNGRKDSTNLQLLYLTPLVKIKKQEHPKKERQEVECIIYPDVSSGWSSEEGKTPPANAHTRQKIS